MIKLQSTEGTVSDGLEMHFFCFYYCSCRCYCCCCCRWPIKVLFLALFCILEQHSRHFRVSSLSSSIASNDNLLTVTIDILFILQHRVLSIGTVFRKKVLSHYYNLAVSPKLCGMEQMKLTIFFWL